MPIAAMTIAGALLVTAGAFLPWLSLFAGLQTVAGTSGLNGRLLVGGGAVSGLLGLWFLIRGGSATRWVIGLLGIALLGFCGWLLLQLLATYRELSTDPFMFARLSPGLFISTGGAATVAGTILLGGPPALRPGPAHSSRFNALPLASVLAPLSFGAGVIHWAVIGPHWQESTTLAAAFAAAGLSQILWAWLVLMAPDRRTLVTGIALSAVYVAVWAASRTAGLPVGDAAWQAEPAGAADLITVVLESLTLLGALVLWRRAGRPLVIARWPGVVVSTLGVAAITAMTLVAVLSGSGALDLLRR
ncbi:MAG TPA: hypothetical protein VK821_18675 [Dehalococcoidia bacterium]|nr:hypothetical protein [Dehalococcoidia bacterium]